MGNPPHRALASQSPRPEMAPNGSSVELTMILGAIIRQQNVSYIYY